MTHAEWEEVVKDLTVWSYRNMWGIETSCDDCRHRERPWDMFPCDDCYGSHCAYEPKEDV